MRRNTVFIPLLALSFLLASLWRARARRPAAHSQPADDYAALDDYLSAQMRRLRIPGAALAVVAGQHIVHQCGFGRARPGGEPPTPHTPFFIGSLTKSITALAVMQLVEAGKIALDAPVQRYLPWFRVADPRASAALTVRHLLNQTSGLPTLAGNQVLVDFDPHPQAAERQARELAALQLSHPPGTVCQYSNLNYNLLGLVVEAASGETYAGYLQQHIFNPLGMQHTYTCTAAARRAGLAVGHRYWFARPVPVYDPPVPHGSLASGQLISCTADLARYLGAMLNGGRLGDAQILSAQGVAELQRGAAELIFMGIPSGRYGMGWFETDLGPTKTFSHGGNTPDFSAHMALIPAQRTGLVLLINADHYGLPVILEEVGAGLTALLAGHQPPPIRLGFVPWLMRLLPLLPALQIAGVLVTLRGLARWRRDPGRQPEPVRLWSRRILLPLIPDLSLAGGVLYLRTHGILPFLDLFIPDLAWVARFSGGFAAVWAALRTVWVLRAGRDS